MNNIVSYVIRTKDEEELLDETCKRIKDQIGSIQHEIIIVDSGSKDSTLKIAEKYADLIVKISPRDFSWGYALNRGIEASSGDVICLLSGHCLLGEEKVISIAYNKLINSNYVALYGLQVGNPLFDKMEAIEMLEFYPKNAIDNIKAYELPGKELPGVSNACCLLKKYIWEHYRFDEKLQSAEDSAWYHLITSKGYKILYFPDFYIIHAHHFNIIYMYKKWYWRVYQIEKNKKIKQNYFYIFLSFMNGMTRKMIRFYLYAQNVDIKVNLLDCLKYSYIRETATLKARCELKKRRNKYIGYNELIVPQNIVSLGNTIKPGDFNDL